MKNSWFKYIFIIFVIGIIIFAVVKIQEDEHAPKNETASEKTKQDEKIKEITIGIAEKDILNPILSNNKNVQDVSRLIYDPLVNISNDYKPESALAIEWAKQDANTYIIKLRENVKWSDGSEFDSEDVRYTIDRLKDTPSIYSSNVQYVSGVETVDEHTLKINLSQEVPFFEYYLTFPIMSRKYYGEEDFANTDKNSAPVGTGKYKISEVQESNIVLSKNENWWNAKKIGLTLEKINVNLYGTVGELYNNFKTGSLDVLATTNNNFSDYIGTIGYNLKEVRGREHIFLALNTTSPNLSDVETRKIISQLIDKTSITNNVYGSKYYTTNFPLEYGTYLYKGNGSFAEYNIEQAKQDLESNGWSFTKGIWVKKVDNKVQKLVLSLVVKASNNENVRTAENIKTQLEGQGIKVNIIQTSDEKYQEYKTNKNYDMILCDTYLPISPDLTTFFGENNLANFSTDETIQIMNEVKNTNDEKTLKEKYEKLEQIYATQVPYISLVNSKYNVIYNSNLVGDVAPNWYNIFYNIEGWYKN